MTYLTKVKGVSRLRALNDFVAQAFDEIGENERVDVRVKHADSVTESVFEKRVKGVPVRKQLKFK